MIKNITCLFATLLSLAACTGKEDPVQEPVAVGFTLAQETKAGFVGDVDGNILRATRRCSTKGATAGSIGP